jgi:endonuclease/exonuclease/phosphatase family metal-dependent hydrolase
MMGDFNSRPGTSEYNTMVSAYHDTWVEGVNAGIAWSPSGTYGYTHGYSRFDFVWESRGASSLALTSVKVLNTAVSGVKPSDHDPVLATFSIR